MRKWGKNPLTLILCQNQTKVEILSLLCHTSPYIRCLWKSLADLNKEMWKPILYDISVFLQRAVLQHENVEMFKWVFLPVVVNISRSAQSPLLKQSRNKFFKLEKLGTSKAKQC